MFKLLCARQLWFHVFHILKIWLKIFLWAFFTFYRTRNSIYLNVVGSYRLRIYRRGKKEVVTFPLRHCQISILVG